MTDLGHLIKCMESFLIKNGGIDYGIFMEIVNFIGILKKNCNFLKGMPTLIISNKNVLNIVIIKDEEMNQTKH
jgi:hypothetical protein